ncbi:purine-nucleoside phosphorylase [Oceanobacillus sp. 143]|uniref:Purine nucleoside phosphorylase n=1 Tax=Oceanobacillus zhaokaii TaxID=2052660 RepID=A0A345PHB8_9BACI|nr:purine-nucleoside phosphorylase [Oceanobacillus zhaokaii]AXI09398.1 purine-nucleoside phosphorylase [Oceanobacillus zhaokaii]QGS68841.1 purine-nucleoside phosphorylase [Oceanobacillus sp. 143]
MNQAKIKEASNYIENKNTSKPTIGLILGSGLGVLADQIENPVTIEYKDIPHFPESTVAGHKGQLVIGSLEGKQVIAMQGRFHYYEGYTMEQVTFPVRVMKQLGIESLIVTNAAGGINTNFNPGDLMLITDHLNNMGTNPLIGKNDDRLGDRFPDMSRCYDQSYIEHAEQCAKELNLTIRKGVYVGNTGPSYETPAEIRMLRILGGDAVGMSTVPEVIVANHAKIRVLGISCISNMAAGILEQPLTHTEVIDTTNKVREDFLQFIKKVIHTLPQ